MRLHFQNAKANVTPGGKLFEVKNKLLGVSANLQWPEEGEMILMLESQTSVPVDSRRELPEGLNLKEYTYSWYVGICHLKKPFQVPSTELPYYWRDWRDTKTKPFSINQQDGVRRCDQCAKCPIPVHNTICNLTQLSRLSLLVSRMWKDN